MTVRGAEGKQHTLYQIGCFDDDSEWTVAKRFSDFDELREFLEETYTDEGAAREAHRFRETAYVFWKRGDEEAATACLAAALAFESSPIGENPVARAMLEIPLAPVLEKIDPEGEDPQESSLLVKP